MLFALSAFTVQPRFLDEGSSDVNVINEDLFSLFCDVFNPTKLQLA